MTLEESQQLVALYAEDEPLSRSICKDLMEHYFKSVITCENGDEGIKKFDEFHPDIVITDLAMPITDGFTLIRHIRSISKTLPIIITTAYREEAKKAELVDGILFKPIKVNELWNILKEIKRPSN